MGPRLAVCNSKPQLAVRPPVYSEAGTALSWRLHRDERGWRAFVSFNHQPAERTTLDGLCCGWNRLQRGHLAVTETDAYGNLLQTSRLPPLCEEATSSQRNAVLSDALTEVVA